MKVAGRWTYLYRAIDQHGQVIDVLLSQHRDLAAARRFFTRALRAGTVPAEVTTDRAPAYPRVLEELVPSAMHTVERYANNPVEADHGSSPPGTRSCRTSAAATMNSPPTSPPATGSPQHSTSSRGPSEQPITCPSALCHAHRSTNATLPVPPAAPESRPACRPPGAQEDGRRPPCQVAQPSRMAQAAISANWE